MHVTTCIAYEPQNKTQIKDKRLKWNKVEKRTKAKTAEKRFIQIKFSSMTHRIFVVCIVYINDNLRWM